MRWFVIKSYSARNIPLHRRGVFIYKNGDGSATFYQRSYQYVQRSYQIIEYPHRLHTMAKIEMSKIEKAAYNPALDSKL